MKKSFIFVGLLALVLGSARPAKAEPTVGSWLASAGLGLTFSPTLVLLNPQLEYVMKHNLFIGPNLQLGLSDGVLFAASGSIRYVIGRDPRIKPNIEGGLGLALASSAFASSVGVLIHFGMGVDYQLNRNIAIGTMFRGNLAPPLKTFFLAWPVIIGRFSI